MAKIAVLGLGAMGSRMAVNLIKAGYEVTVWNRSPRAVISLVAAGAKRASTPMEAASGVDFVMAMVRDDQASNEVWLDAKTGALAGMAPGSVAIESSTLTPHWVRTLGDAMATHKVSLLEAPVSGTRPQADAAQLIYLVGGDEVLLRRAEPVLSAMGSAIHLVGPLGAGAIAKLATNAMIGIQVTALAELMGMLERSGADVDRTLEALAATPVWSVIAQRVADAMRSGDFSPQFPVELIEKDFGYVLQAAGSEDAAPTLAAARHVFRKAIERGYGSDNMTGVVRLFINPVSIGQQS